MNNLSKLTQRCGPVAFGRASRMGILASLRGAHKRRSEGLRRSVVVLGNMIGDWPQQKAGQWARRDRSERSRPEFQAWVVLALMTAGLFAGCRPSSNGDPSSDADTSQASAVALRQIGLVSEPADVQELVDQLEPIDRHELRRQRDRFRSLAARDRSKLITLHEEICATKEGAALYGVLHRYSEWLGTLPDGQRADLLELPIEERIAKIRETQVAQRDDLFQRDVVDLSAADAQQVLEWWHQYLEKNSDDLIAQLPTSVQERIRRTNRARRRGQTLATEILRRADQIEFPPADQTRLLTLRDSLSPEGASRLADWDGLENKDPSVREAVRRLGVGAQRRNSRDWPNRERLMQFYDEELTVPERDRIDELPPKQMQRELKRQFLLRERGRPGDHPPPHRDGDPAWDNFREDRRHRGSGQGPELRGGGPPGRARQPRGSGQRDNRPPGLPPSRDEADSTTDPT